ncbi:MAG: RecX family transcriptional regulator [Actinomycetota bacterium]|nr:RecX family transcriptional regulator [Actinomycetota bacterium]
MAAGAGQSERQRAIDLAWKALNARERTAFELRTYLENKKIEPAAIDQAVAELTEAGFLDDADYARRFAEDRRAVHSWGRDRIERDLLRRGVEPRLIERALAGEDGYDELGAALAVLGERLRGPPEGDRERNRAWQMLVRRGYSSELAYEAVRRHGREAA